MVFEENCIEKQTKHQHLPSSRYASLLELTEPHQLFKINYLVKVKTYFVYILKCNDGSYYTGITNDISRRFQEHNNATDPSAYTSSRRPVELVFHEGFSNPETAIQFEKKIKKWSRKKKEALIESRFDDLPALSKKNFKT